VKPHNPSDSIKVVLCCFTVEIGAGKKNGEKRGVGGEKVKKTGEKVKNGGEKNQFITKLCFDPWTQRPNPGRDSSSQ
jgi:hypothetical protein